MAFSDMRRQKKKKSRVQGGWAHSSAPSVSSTINSAHSVHIFQDPKRIQMPPGERPPNFSWVLDNILAGSSLPQQKSHFDYFLNQGIKHIITLCEWKPPMHMAPIGLSNLFLPIEEFMAPALEDIIRFVEYVDDARQRNEGVVAHCYWGRGRTGTMLACYLVKDQDMDPHEAISIIRHRRPYSVETYEQEDAIVEYANYLKAKPSEEQPV